MYWELLQSSANKGIKRKINALSLALLPTF